MLSLLSVCALSVSDKNIPKGCQRGLIWTRYDTLKPEEGKVIDGPDVVSGIPYTGDLGYTYDSQVWTGAYCAPRDGLYTFFVSAKIGGNLVVDGSQSNEAGSGGGCHSERKTGSITLQLKAHTCYPLRGLLRTGCVIYKYHFRVTMQLDGADYNGDNDVITCYSKKCEDGYWGSSCSPCTVDCHGNGYCSNGTTGTGKCICYSGSPDSGCIPPTPVFTASSHFTPSNPFTPVFTAGSPGAINNLGRRHILRKISISLAYALC